MAGLLAAGVTVIVLAQTTYPARSQGFSSYKWDANWQPEWLSILPIAKEAAAPILRGEPGDPSYLQRLRQAHQALPVSIPRPELCYAFMVSAVSKSRSSVEAVRREAHEAAQRSLECYEGMRVDGTVPPAPKQAELKCDPNAAGPRDRPLIALAAASLPRSEWLRAKSQNASGDAGLWIGGIRFTKPTDLRSTDFIQFLKQNGSQKNLRIEILCAMMRSQHRRFVFQSESDLRWNIALRERFIQEMKKAFSPPPPPPARRAAACHFAGDPKQFYVRGWQLYRDDRGAHNYERLPDGLPGKGAWRTTPTVSAHVAILWSRQAGVDCLLGVQLMVLEAVDAVLAQQPTSGTVGSQFNALHPISGSAPSLFGLGIPLNTLEDNSSFLGPRFDIHIYPPSVNSAAMHLIVVRVHIRPDRKNPPAAELDQLAGPLAGPITIADMVPGDHVYMENKADYKDHYPRGAWNGENAIYMEKGQFAGLGVGFVTEDQLQRELADAYNLAPGDLHPEAKSYAKASDMQWTLIAAPSLYGVTDEAGRFLNP